eukprot:96657-Rhodomonas_salina.2
MPRPICPYVLSPYPLPHLRYLPTSCMYAPMPCPVCSYEGLRLRLYPGTPSLLYPYQIAATSLRHVCMILRHVGYLPIPWPRHSGFDSTPAHSPYPLPTPSPVSSYAVSVCSYAMPGLFLRNVRYLPMPAYATHASTELAYGATMSLRGV